MQHEDWMPSATPRDVISAWLSAAVYLLPILLMSFDYVRP
jgi:hypothetical protein